MPTSLGLMRHSAACRRTSFMASSASEMGTCLSPLGMRYFNTMAAMSILLKNGAQSRPSLSIANVWYPPPGQITTALPVAIFSRGKNTCTFAVSLSSLPATAGADGHKLRVKVFWAKADVAAVSIKVAANKNLFVFIFFVLLCLLTLQS